ncbi:MAG: tRNA uridine-5-carboxymethylaminomethyl(34) synthesis GTPase MnmE [Rhodobacteraceae bacterium]|nr:tRNA uridine-5-carboxymethylaminomethyl(34) synthesis GTPase MnmE [Paracoccaceae bacterium]
MDTIFALSTARGRAGVAVIRVSGSLAWSAAERMAGPGLGPRRASLRKLRDAEGRVLDSAVVLLFERGASFTGEDVAEFMVHGSPAVVAAVESELGRLTGLRYAEPGEFTRRALMNGVLDLVQVEGLGDLLQADTERQRSQAMALMEGALGRRVAGWRDVLVRAAALMEAEIDFADEGLGQFDVQAAACIAEVVPQIARELRAVPGREKLRDGFQVAIVGPVNAGKSTLLNALAGREAAITSAVAGTTRDVIEVRMDIGGFSVTLLDTAGIRASEDEIERQGVDRALHRADEADIRVVLLESPGAEPVVPPRPGDIVLVGKGDLFPGHDEVVSGLTGVGVEQLLRRLAERCVAMTPSDGLAVNLRQETALRLAHEALLQAGTELEKPEHAPELVSVGIRRALSALDGMMGKVGVEDILGEIFARFCIGK